MDAGQLEEKGRKEHNSTILLPEELKSRKRTRLLGEVAEAYLPRDGHVIYANRNFDYKDEASGESEISTEMFGAHPYVRLYHEPDDLNALTLLLGYYNEADREKIEEKHGREKVVDSIPLEHFQTFDGVAVPEFIKEETDFVQELRKSSLQEMKEQIYNALDDARTRWF